MKRAALFIALLALLISSSGLAHGANSLYFLITIDTETWVGCGPNGCYPTPIEREIQGKMEDKIYGISLMMDILDKHEMKATFFVNSFLDSYYPEDQVRSLVTEITRRGHDVQLHPHEEFRCFQGCSESDLPCLRTCMKEESFLSGNSYENQLEIIREGAENITKWSGKYPVAFRGGGSDADEVTMKVLKELNIPIDSTFNLPSHALHNIFPINKVSEHEGIIEIPEFIYQEDVIVSSKYKYLDIESSTFQEQKILIDSAIENDVRTVVLIMHSYSFCREDLGCPVTPCIERFDNLLSYLKGMDNVKTITMSDFWEQYNVDKKMFVGSGYVPKIGYFLILKRSIIRFNEQGRKYDLFAAANVAAVVLLVGVIFFVIVRRVKRRRKQS